MAESKNRNEMVEEAKWAIIDYLADGYEGYLSDLHNEVFNEDFYTSDEMDAIDTLNEFGGYDVVSECIRYEQDNFGQVSGEKYANPVWVLSMEWYIVGEEALTELIQNVLKLELDYPIDFDEEMTEEDSLKLSKLFKATMQMF